MLSLYRKSWAWKPSPPPMIPIWHLQWVTLMIRLIIGCHACYMLLVLVSPCVPVLVKFNHVIRHRFVEIWSYHMNERPLGGQTMNTNTHTP